MPPEIFDIQDTLAFPVTVLIFAVVVIGMLVSLFRRAGR